MGQTIRVYLKEEELERLNRIARAEGKNLSALVRELINKAVKQDMRETNLLDKLISKLEVAPTLHDFALQTERNKDMLVRLFTMFYEYQKSFVEMFFIDKAKAQKLLALVTEIEEKISHL